MSGFDGTWQLTLHAPGGDEQVSLALVTDPPSGTLSGTNGERSDVTDVVFDGNTAKWKARITSPMPIGIAFSASVDGDEMNGIATAAAMIKIPFDGKRV